MKKIWNKNQDIFKDYVECRYLLKKFALVQYEAKKITFDIIKATKGLKPPKIVRYKK